MSVVNRPVQSVSSLFKSCMLLDRACIYRSVRSIPKARCHGGFLPRCLTRNSDLCHHWHRVPASACDFRPKRFYSEVFHDESSRSKQNNGESEEDAEEVERDAGVSQRPLPGFSLDVLVSLLRQENAVDICVIKVPEYIKYTEFFLVVGGISSRHLRAMALYAVKVHKYLKRDKDPHAKVEGKDSEDWMCVDFGNMVVHFMLPETRDVYELEKLWTLRRYDEQLMRMPAETLPEDFVYDVEVTK